MRNIEDDFDVSFEKHPKKKKIDLSYEEYNPKKSSLEKKRPTESVKPERSMKQPLQQKQKPIKQKKIVKKRPKREPEFGFEERVKDFFANAGLGEYLVIFTTFILLIAAVITFSTWESSKEEEAGAEALIPIGEQLGEVAVHSDILVETIIASFTGGQEANRVLANLDESVEITATFNSIMQDLKVKFVNKSTDELITGIPFRIEIIPPIGEPFTATDEDKDGMIYVRDLEAGAYQVICKSVGNVKFSDTPVDVAVKDQLDYQEINIINEVKKESEINVSEEDTAEQDVVTESVLQDTVGWITSTKTPVGDGSGYVEVLKDSITDPATVGSLENAFYKVTTVNYNDNIEVGGSAVTYGTPFQFEFKATGITDDDESLSCAWKIDEEDQGEVQGEDVFTFNIDPTDYQADPGYGNTGLMTIKVIVTCSNSDKNGIGILSMVVKSAEEAPTVSSVTLSKSGDQILTPGGDLDILATVNFSNGTTSSNATWTSNNVADTIDFTDNGSGSLTVSVAVNATTNQTETFTATSADGTKTVSVKIIVREVDSDISVSLDKSEVTIKRPATVQLNATVTNSDTNNSVTWSSSDTAIAAVDSSGVVTPVGGGEAIITATTKEDKQSSPGTKATATCTVTVSPLTISLKSGTGGSTPEKIYVGKTVDLTAAFTNRLSTDPITWKTSDATIGTITKKTTTTAKDVYTFKALKEGAVDITVYSTKGLGKEKSQPVAVYRFVISVDPKQDTTMNLNDDNGTQIYVKDGTDYREAKYADFYTFTNFYVKGLVEYTYTGWQTMSDNKTYYFDKNGNKVTGNQVIQGVSYAFSSAGVLSMGDGTVGIDVSKYQGNIDWAAVKASGVDFAIIRCGYRGYTNGSLIIDPKFEQNIAGATNAGLKVGVYFFTQAITEVEAVEEASMALALTSNYNLTYPIFIDSEGSGGRADGLDVTTRTAILKAFCQTVTNAGGKAGIYASKNWYKNKLNVSQLNAYTIWMAQYATTPTYTGRYDIWQHSSSGHVGGIEKNVDMNKSYLSY